MEKRGESLTGYALLSRYRGELMGLAMLLVMLFHTYQAPIPLQVLSRIRNFGYLGVDVFIFLSGMGLRISLSKRPALGPYFGRRAIRILPAYWLVVGTYGLWLRWMGRTRLINVVWSLSTLHYWFHIPDTFNWYIPALIAFYVLAPFYGRLLQKVRYQGLLTVCVFPLSFALYRLAASLGASHINDFLFRLPAFAMGCLVGERLASGKAVERREWAGWGALAAVGIGVILLSVTGRLGLFIPACYLFGAILVPVCLLTAWVVGRIPWGWFGAFLRAVGGSSLEIYLLNVVFTREYDLLRGALGWIPGQWVYFGLMFCVNILLGMGLHRLLEPLTKALEGRLSRKEV